ncbi:hypothetical protein [Paenibacillus sp. BJ-4]|uniref:hypothetical protein n=1 Tax=Paenibacillus sp. BJ-4 TaxID=2878097 RepID=UPI001CEFE979|nr:hypothetical protein [Paenibacillus sp. BJ-4]
MQINLFLNRSICRLLFRPLEEVKNYRSNLFEQRDILLTGQQIMETGGDSYELKVVFEYEAGNTDEFGLKLRVGSEEETIVPSR